MHCVRTLPSDLGVQTFGRADLLNFSIIYRGANSSCAAFVHGGQLVDFSSFRMSKMALRFFLVLTSHGVQPLLPFARSQRLPAFLWLSHWPIGDVYTSVWSIRLFRQLYEDFRCFQGSPIVKTIYVPVRAHYDSLDSFDSITSGFTDLTTTEVLS